MKNSRRECVSGDHDSDKDGRIDYTLECYDNGVRKTRTDWNTTGQDELVRFFSTYRRDGSTHSLLEFFTYGAPKSESTFWESGRLKTFIPYRFDGVQKSSPECYNEVSGAFELCTFRTHGCT